MQPAVDKGVEQSARGAGLGFVFAVGGLASEGLVHAGAPIQHEKGMRALADPLYRVFGQIQPGGAKGQGEDGEDRGAGDQIVQQIIFCRSLRQYIHP